MKARILSKTEKIFRPLIRKLNYDQIIKVYSRGRIEFMDQLKEEQSLIRGIREISRSWQRDLWGITHQSPIMNAAGMFKNGECYSMVVAQGAGAYMGGTGTWNSREGNTKEGIYLPFLTYPESGATSNSLGLPNEGDHKNIERARDISNNERVERVPIWWSAMGSPDFQGEEKLSKLACSMESYYFNGVDVIEENESCPNTGEKLDYSNLWKTMDYISKHFIRSTEEKPIVVLKLSNDVHTEDIPMIMDHAFSKGYSGINFGNTSTDYLSHIDKMHPSEKQLSYYYSNLFEGGISGRPLKEKSLELASKAVEYLNNGKPEQEFHVIRTGGIESLQDIIDSESAGISMNQWHTGYWDKFREHGNDVYKRFFEGD